MNFLINLLRPQSRQAAARAFPQFSSAAVTIFGVGFTRNQILHISLLLFLRSILSAIPLPIDQSVSAYMWSSLFAYAQASILIAAGVNFLDWGGMVSRFISTHFLLRSSTPFLRLYSILVLIAGPVATLLEPVIIAFEIMSLSRTLQHHMFTWEARGGGHAFRVAILTCVMGILIAVGAIQQWIRSYSFMTANVVCVVGIAIILAACITTSANVVEAALLALYVSLTGVAAVTEKLEYAVNNQELRAGVLVYSVMLLFLLLIRGPRFVKVATKSYDAVQEEESRTSTASMAQHPNATEQTGRRDEELEEVKMGSNGIVVNGFLSAFAVLVVTFRVLVWSKQIETSEYLALPTRWAQAGVTFVFYVMLLMVP